MDARRRRYAGLDEVESGLPELVEFSEGQPWYRRRSIQVLMIAAGVILVIGVVLAIALPVALNEDSGSKNNENKRVFGFDDIFNTSTEALSVAWWCPTAATSPVPASLVYQDKGGNIIRQIVTNATRAFPDVGNQQVLFNKTSFLAAAPENAWAASIGSYTISPTGDAILFAVNVTYRWRHSYFANLFVYKIAASTAALLDPQNNRLMSPVWAPTNNNIAFVRDNNIYVADSSGTAAVRQVTTDGTPGRQPDGVSIVNGVQSWVYEEEVFSDVSAMWWSTDSAHLAFLKFNETLVREFFMPVYTGEAYPTIENLAYPKAGYPNPQVTVGVYSVANDSTIVLDWSEAGAYEYVTGVWWIDARVVAVRRLNRLQNEEQTVLFDIVAGTSRVLFSKTSKAWVETQFELTFLRETDGSILYFVDLVANNQSFPQVALHNYSTGAFIRFLSDPANNSTKEVVRINRWLPSSRTLIYTSAEPGPDERRVYAQAIEDTTTATKTEMSSGQGWWSISHSPCSDLFTLNFGGNGDFLHVPTVHLRSSANKALNVALVTNANLKQQMSSLKLPRKEFLTVANDAGESMVASLLYPPNFDSRKKYPVLMHVYGGPNSQEVTRAYPLGGQKSFDLYMASRGYLVGQVDGRGTAARGEDWRHVIYLNLGAYETRDQLAAARHFGQLAFADSSRVGIWGWSYGGYMSAMTGSDPAGVLKLAMSVAPGTDWRFYDTVYTERYMRTPDLNPSGYTNSSVLNRADGFVNLKYLLAQGTADDNVHLQNAAELSKVLVQRGVDFEQMYYTNSAHSINTGNARRHLFRKLSRFAETSL